MRAAEMKERPSFSLMKQGDVQTIYHMQMPRWLFSDPRYADMSLDAKVTYTFLLNRFQLSRRNGWVNDFGEVFVIFPRKELARELRICEQRVTAAFKKLVELKLVWEKRCGRGDANQIYLASVEPLDNPGYSSAPFVSEPDGDSRNAESEGLDPVGIPMPEQEPQNLSGKNLQNCGSRTAESAAAEPQKIRPSYIKSSQTDFSHTDVSQSVSAGDGDRQADDEEELMGILDACELHCFSPKVARVFENAIERLFYLEHFRVGGATLPRSRVRARLQLLDGMILRDAERKLRANMDREVKNSTAYTMATIFNCIAESESDLMVDPDLNRMTAMLRQLRSGLGDFHMDGDFVYLARDQPDDARLEGIDVMLELSESAPQDFTVRAESPRLLRFALGGDKLKLFSVAKLSHISEPQQLQRERSERIVWISDSGAPPEGLSLPPKHFFAARQEDGSHRFYGSNGS